MHIYQRKLHFKKPSHLCEGFLAVYFIKIERLTAYKTLSRKSFARSVLAEAKNSVGFASSTIFP